ncbi:uncharacterized protein LOC144098573 isoform X2 [Amblyomma americanum]
MIFGIMLGIVLFVGISITLIGLYVAFKRFCSDAKDYGMINANSSIKHGRLYPVLNYKDCDDDGPGGSGSTTQCLDNHDLDVPEIKVPGSPDHHEDLSCMPLTADKEPDYATPVSLTKPYGAPPASSQEHHSEAATSSSWKPPEEHHAVSHVNEGFHGGPPESSSGGAGFGAPAAVHDADADGEE